ncbi:MAG: ParB/RepB/Spo0J family partition protein [Pirellulales bacterium]|nr:ParB/RepB/Spo0J family partition protein [Pirellulales bacterium]
MNTVKTRSKNNPAQNEVSPDTFPDSEWSYLPLHLIEPNAANPRGDWEDQDLEKLVPSIEAVGILQAIVVRPINSPAGPRYQLIAGERRFRAAQLAKLKTIPARIRAVNDQTMLDQILVENVQRKDLNPIEKAKLLERICQPLAAGGGGKSHVAAAKLFGKTHSWTTNLIRLLKLPESFLQKIAKGEMLESQGRLLVPHCDNPEILEAVSKDMEQNPWAWKSRDDFERSLGLVIARSTGELKDHKPRMAREDSKFDNPPIAAMPNASVQMKSTADLEYTETMQEVESFILDDICEAIHKLSSLDSLARVISAADNRKQELLDTNLSANSISPKKLA